MKRITAIGLAALIAIVAFHAGGHSTQAVPAIAVAPYDGGSVSLTLDSGRDAECAPWEHAAQLAHDVAVVDVGCWISNRETISLRWPHSGRRPSDVAISSFRTRSNPAPAATA